MPEAAEFGRFMPDIPLPGFAYTKRITGGWEIHVSDPNAYERFCTVEALQQLGA